MTIYIENHPFHYEMENLCRVFYPNEKLKLSYEPENRYDDPFYAYLGRSEEGETAVLTVSVQEDRFLSRSDSIPRDAEDYESECERRLAVLLFELLKELTGISPCWGILTGVRPVKLMRRLLGEAGGEQAAKKRFQSKFLVTEQKTELCLATMKAEQKILSLSRPDSFSLYVSIPFCPTRCAYCSFVSQSVEKAKRLMPKYVELLCRELKATAQLAKDLKLRLETVYVGGGTPTTLTAEDLKRLCDTINEYFDMGACREFTVEAGRPDTITGEKLKALKDGGVDRISINPQTLNDHVLETIGRRHSARQVIEAFQIAREMGFTHINMDLIAGLPEDTLESFQDTVQKISALSPESITIHTLAMKKASNLTQQGKQLYREECEQAAAMLDVAGEVLPENGYAPYYLYRQSRMVGNLENVGWSKKGYEGLYNVYVMDETHTILSCGAGGVTKAKEPNGEYLERIFNFKFPYEYISRFSELMDRKEQVRKFYDKFRKLVP